MDKASPQAIQLLNAVAGSIDRLNACGYTLVLESKAATWKQARTITVSSTPFRIGEDGNTRHYERAITFGCSICPIPSRALIFGILIAWNATEWLVSSDIEEEDINLETDTQFIWSQEYSVAVFSDLTQAIRTITDELLHQTTTNWFWKLLSSDTNR